MKKDLSKRLRELKLINWANILRSISRKVNGR